MQIFKPKAFIAIAFFMLAPFSYASSLQDVADHMDALLKGVAPEKILLILDVDGTLTNNSIPGNHETKPRGNAVDFVKIMASSGVKLVVSSAWHDFSETQTRLSKLGLLKALNAESAGVHKSTMAISGAEISFENCISGLLCSVKNPLKDGQFYRRKALAALLVYPDLNLEEIEHVIFADDSLTNVNTFIKDIKWAKLFPVEKVKTFLLSPANGEEDLK